MDETGKPESTTDGRVRDDVLFLAGECAGLLFFQGFAAEAADGD